MKLESLYAAAAVEVDRKEEERRRQEEERALAAARRATIVRAICTFVAKRLECVRGTSRSVEIDPRMRSVREELHALGGPAELVNCLHWSRVGGVMADVVRELEAANPGVSFTLEGHADVYTIGIDWSALVREEERRRRDADLEQMEEQ